LPLEEWGDVGQVGLGLRSNKKKSLWGENERKEGRKGKKEVQKKERLG